MVTGGDDAKRAERDGKSQNGVLCRRGIPQRPSVKRDRVRFGAASLCVPIIRFRAPPPAAAPSSAERSGAMPTPTPEKPVDMRSMKPS